MNTGLLYVVLAEFFWAAELILVRKFFPTENSIFVAGMTSIIATILYIPTFYFSKIKFNQGNWVVLLILGLTSFFLAQIFYVKGIQNGPSAFSLALATLTMPLFAVIMGLIFFKETITVPVIVGGILMIAGFCLISIR